MIFCFCVEDAAPVHLKLRNALYGGYSLMVEQWVSPISLGSIPSTRPLLHFFNSLKKREQQNVKLYNLLSFSNLSG